jgi:hypothetical protein
MARPKLITLTASEARIWEAAFAASWVRLFHDGVAIRERLGQARTWDKEMQEGNAEEAESIANAAVADLRRYRKEGAFPTNHERGAPKKVDTRWIEAPAVESD